MGWVILRKGRGVTVRSSTLRCMVMFALLLACARSAVASDVDPSSVSSPYGFLEEVRFGAADHNAFMRKERRGGSGNFDALAEVISRPLPFFASDDRLARVLLNPRLTLGTTLSPRGQTSVAYGGFLWRMPLVGAVFAEAEFGGAFNNSPHHNVPGRIDMACPTTFHESIGLGVELAPHIDLVADVEHASHAYLCGRQNPGITNVGFKLGYRF